MKLEERASGKFAYDPERAIVELVWADVALDEDEVKEMLVRFGEHATAYPRSALFVDARHFNFDWGPAMQDWRAAEVVPAYNLAGVRKFAFVFSKEVPVGTPTRTEPDAFETGAFHSREDAVRWLLAD